MKKNCTDSAYRHIISAAGELMNRFHRCRRRRIKRTTVKWLVVILIRKIRIAHQLTW